MNFFGIHASYGEYLGEQTARPLIILTPEHCMNFFKERAKGMSPPRCVFIEPI